MSRELDGERLGKTIDDAFFDEIDVLYKVLISNLASVPHSFKSPDDCVLAFRSGMELAWRAHQLAGGVADQFAAGGRGRN